jgi:hypothetical protein
MRLVRSTLMALAAAGLAIASAGCQPKIPEQDSYAGQLYMRRCGQCHAPYNPQSMTAAMWEIEVPKMEQKMLQAGFPPMASDQKQIISDYLHRNAGHQ